MYWHTYVHIVYGHRVYPAFLISLCTNIFQFTINFCWNNIYNKLNYSTVLTTVLNTQIKRSNIKYEIQKKKRKKEMRRSLKHCNIKSVSCIMSTLLVLYLIFSSGYHKYEIDGIIRNTRPEDVWNFVADFNKMKLLNPTMYVIILAI